jgi:hypothetical protein
VAGAPPTIAADISGDVAGQVAVGSHIVQVSAAHGAIVNVAAAASVTARPAPVTIRPRDFAGLLGRASELERTLAALGDGMTVDLHGPAGIGKTSLLRHLCHRGADGFEHGVVFVRAAGEPLEDVAQFLFDAFYASDPAVKPTPAELRHRLADRHALVVVDDLGGTRDELEELLGCAPACTFLLGSVERLLWGEGVAQELGGLDDDAALALFERELGRELAGDERTRAAEQCRALGGRPLAVLQAAALARDGAATAPAAGDTAVEATLRERLGGSARRVLALLELLAPAAVDADDIKAITQLADAGEALEHLVKAGAAQAHSSRWSATLAPREASERSAADAPSGSGAPDDLPLDAADDLLLARAARRFAEGGERRPPEDMPAVLAVLDAAAREQRWADVMRVARGADALLTLGRRWGAWQVAAQHAHEAALASGDRHAEAWALHQLGTRAGCLGDVKAARPQLKRALALRRALGDEAGAAVTAHNLKVLRPRGLSPLKLLAIGVTVAVLGAGAAAVLGAGGGASPARVAHTTTSTRSTHPPPVVSTATHPTTPTSPPTTSTETRAHRSHQGGTTRRKPPPPPPPPLTVDPTSLTFPAIPVGATETSGTVPEPDSGLPTPPPNVTVANDTAAAITLGTPVTGQPFAISRTDCGTAPLASGARCTVEVSFSPASAGTAQGTLTLPGSSTTVPLTGTGTPSRKTKRGTTTG